MKKHIIQCMVALTLLIGLAGMAAAAPITSITEIPGGITIDFSDALLGDNLDDYLTAKPEFAMKVLSPMDNFTGFVDDLFPHLPGNGNTGPLSPNSISFGFPTSSTITIETTGLPWIAVGYAGGVEQLPTDISEFSIKAYDENNVEIENSTGNFTNDIPVFVGVKTSVFTPIHKIDLTFNSPIATFAWFDNLTFKPIDAPNVQPLVDLDYNGYTYTLGSPTLECAGGVLALTLNFQYNGAANATKLRFRIQELTAPRTAIGANGSDVGIPDANLGPDETLTTGELFDGDLSLCLPNLSRFTLLLDVYGSQPTPTRRVFVTSTTYDGNLGGLAGADAKCQMHADAGGLGGVWTAWLSASGMPASSRMAITDSFYALVGGTIIATDLNDLINSFPIEPIFLTELGTIAQTDVWTGTGPNGLETANTCNGWISNLNSDFGDHGSSVENSGFWTLMNTSPASCDSKLALYCFEN